MDKNRNLTRQLDEMTDLMQSLSARQNKMARVRTMFPNYHTHLQHTYNQTLLAAKERNMTPPWMAA